MEREKEYIHKPEQDFRWITWSSSPSRLVLVPPGPFFGFHLRFCGLILCGLRVWNQEKQDTHTHELRCKVDIQEKKWGGGNRRLKTTGENDISHLLSSTEFDGSLKRAAERAQSEINGLKQEHDMKPAAAYKTTWKGGGCRYSSLR